MTFQIGAARAKDKNIWTWYKSEGAGSAADTWQDCQNPTSTAPRSWQLLLTGVVYTKKTTEVSNENKEITMLVGRRAMLKYKTAVSTICQLVAKVAASPQGQQAGPKQKEQRGVWRRRGGLEASTGMDTWWGGCEVVWTLEKLHREAVESLSFEMVETGLDTVLNSLLQLPAHPALGRGLDEAVSRAATRLNNFVLQCEKIFCVCVCFFYFVFPKSLVGLFRLAFKSDSLLLSVAPFWSTGSISM